MEKRVFFDDARKNVLELFSIEFPTLSLNDIDVLIGLFYKFVNYEEEGVKIKPNIILTSNINQVMKNVPGSKKIIFYEDEDTSELKSHLKALMCFCRTGWHIYINFGEEIIEYGIVKNLTSIKERSLQQQLHSKDVLENISKRTNMITISVLGSGVCRLSGARGSSCAICFNLNSQTEYDWDNQIHEFVEACVSKIKTTKKKLEDIKTLLFNIFQRMLKDLHGTICLVVDKEFKDKSGFLQDGTWLKEPIEFGKLFLRSNKYDENVLRSFADVLTTMLDFDGITVIDNAGRIRAYNIFIESSPASQKKIIGGARSRAAYTLLQNKSKKIVGVYFQSQDGDNFYKEKNGQKKKKKVKIVGGEVVNNENDEMLPLEIIAKLQLQKKKEEERLEKEKAEKLEKERLEKEKAEKLEKERLEKERLEKEKAEKLERERPEKEKNEKEDNLEEIIEDSDK